MTWLPITLKNVMTQINSYIKDMGRDDISEVWDLNISDLIGGYLEYSLVRFL